MNILRLPPQVLDPLRDPSIQTTVLPTEREPRPVVALPSEEAQLPAFEGLRGPAGQC